MFPWMALQTSFIHSGNWTVMVRSLYIRLPQRGKSPLCHRPCRLPPNAAIFVNSPKHSYHPWVSSLSFHSYTLLVFIRFFTRRSAPHPRVDLVALISSNMALCPTTFLNKGEGVFLTGVSKQGTPAHWYLVQSWAGMWDLTVQTLDWWNPRTLLRGVGGLSAL